MKTQMCNDAKLIIWIGIIYTHDFNAVVMKMPLIKMHSGCTVKANFMFVYFQVINIHSNRNGDGLVTPVIYVLFC